MSEERSTAGLEPGSRQVSRAHVALGVAIREARSGLGMSQDELAARSEMHRTYVGGIERGERNVSFTNLLRIASALELSPSELLRRAETRG